MSESFAFTVGDRVRIRQDRDLGPGPWPSEPLGTIASHPGASGAIVREVETPTGTQRMYWVKFDEPQRDSDHDGPYASAEVLEIYLELIADSDSRRAG